MSRLSAESRILFLDPGIAMKRIADLVNDLFRTHRKPDGREYSSSEVSRALNGELDPTYMAKLRRGGIPNPGRNTLLLLCRFFGVAPTYFFPELQPPELPES